MSMQRFEFIVRPEENGKRIDHFLAEKIPNISRRKIRTILDVGGCYVNKKRTHIASRTVHTGDSVKAEFNLASLSKVKQKVFELSDADILFENEDIIAINKPPGLPSQATRDQDIVHAQVCVQKWLNQSKSDNRSQRGFKLILVHRLDKETSGILLFAKNATTATALTEDFKHRRVKKTYLAVCHGIPQKQAFDVRCYLSEIDKKTAKVKVVQSGGKPSYTQFEVVAVNRNQQTCLIRCFPETGRSHQIRVHLSESGHPILGDKKYCTDTQANVADDIKSLTSDHHLLHAYKIMFKNHRVGNDLELTAKPPANFRSLVEIAFADIEY